ncbi:MAG: hypothetical protein Q9O62_04560 [Ardenticatenia bacterium]|nr:hypothetical protein [Ardenticatenia bacterium]
MVTANGDPYVLEVNGIPGWKGLQTTTDLDIAAEIVAYLEARCVKCGPEERHPESTGSLHS